MEDRVRQWVDQLGIDNCQVCMTVQAPSPAYRAGVYRMAGQSDLHSIALDQSDLCYNWHHGSLAQQVASRLDWHQLISSLVDQEGLYIEEGLKGVIDQDFSQGSLAVNAIWSAKFLHEEDEHVQAKVLIRALTKWTVGAQHTLLAEEYKALESLDIPPEPVDPHGYDMVFLWLTLAAQNGLFDRVILPFDDFDRIAHEGPWLRDFLDFLRTAQSWASLGSPLGVMIGVCADPLDTLGNTELGRLLQKSLP